MVEGASSNQGRVRYPINLTPRVGTRQGLLPEIYPTPDTGRRPGKMPSCTGSWLRYLPDLIVEWSGIRLPTRPLRYRAVDTRIPTRLLTQNSGIEDG